MEKGFWTLHVRRNMSFHSEEFARLHLEFFASLNSTIVKRPLRIEGLNGQDAGGVVASFLDHLSSAAFCFRENQARWSTSVCEHARVSETDLISRNEKVFSPAPSSLLVTSDELLAQFLPRMRAIGVLIGVHLNTLLYSKSLCLSVPLDRVVLQRLINPESPIADADALDSAVCARATRVAQMYIAPQFAEHYFPGHWPDFESAYSDSFSIKQQWHAYCIGLVNRLLNKTESHAFSAMLEGFQSTLPDGRSDHYLRPDFAHRMLIGDSNITMDLLRSRLEFKVSDERIDEFRDGIFLRVLERLAKEDPTNLNRFAKQVTGLPMLRRSPLSVPITIKWVQVPHEGGFDYWLSTCACVLELALPAGVDTEKWIEIVLGSIVTRGASDTFNIA
jgi:hypothetical protein